MGKDRIISTRITLNGEQAKNELKNVKDVVAQLEQGISRLKDANGNVPNQNRLQYAQLNKELAKQKSIVYELENQLKTYSEVLADTSRATERQLRSALTILKRDMKGITDMAELDKMRKSYDDITKKIKEHGAEWVNVEGIMQKLDTTSEKTLRSALEQLRDLRSMTERGSSDWQNYDEQIKKVEATLDSIGRRSYKDTMLNLDSASSNDIKDAIAQMEELRGKVALGGMEWKAYDAAITRAKDRLAEFSGKAQKAAIDIQMLIGNKMSATPAELKAGIAQLTGDLDNMMVKDPRRSGVKDQITELRNALSLVDDSVVDVTYLLNNLDKASPQQLRTGIAQINAELDKMGMNDPRRDGLKDQVNNLKNALLQVEGSAVDVAQLINNLDNASPNQLRTAIAQVNAELDKMAMSDPRREGLKDQVKTLEEALRGVKIESIDVNDVLSRLSTASLKELRAAAAKLEKEMEVLNTASEEYANKSKEYAQVKKRLDELTRSWKEKENTIKKVMDRLVAYIGIYGAFNIAQDKIRQMITGNLELSDVMADVQKTTGMTAEEISDLSKQIDKIDTRTAQVELHNLAYEAGKLGITGVENVRQFVEGGNQLLVSLGEDLGGAEAVKNLMKINDVLGTTKKLGIEKALLATGSAINEIGQSSTASEGYLVDFAQRLGGIAAQSHLSMAELLALAGTTDALGQNVEVSATALNKFVVTLQTNTREVAQAAGVTDEALNKLLASGKTMDAIVMVLDGLGQKGGIKELAPLMGDLGSDGARLTAVLSSLASNTDMLKNQLQTSVVAFEDATSVTNEYNVKNESAAALIKRMGNAISEYFINSGVVDWLKSVLMWMNNFPSVIERHIVLFSILKGLLISISGFFALKGLKLAVVFLRTTAVEALVSLNSYLAVLNRSIAVHTVGVTGLRKVWIALSLAMKSNLFGIVAVAAATLTIAIVNLVDQSSKAQKSFHDMSVELEEEKEKLGTLKGQIDSVNVANRQRAALIEAFNNNYSSYLGYMLSESANAEEIAKAYRLVNAELERKYLLEAKEDSKKKIRSYYAPYKIDAVKAMRNELKNSYGITGELQARIIYDIEDMLKNTTMSVEQIIEKFESKYSVKRGVGTRIVDALFQRGDQETSNDLSIYLKTYRQNIVNETKEMEDASITFDGEIKAWSTQSIVERQKIINNMTKSIFTPQALKNVDKSKIDLENYLKLNEAQAVRLEQAGLKTSKLYQYVIDNIARARKHTEVKLGGGSNKTPWGGDPFSLETASVDKLVAKYKEYFDWRKQINADKNYTAFKDSGFKSRVEEMDALMKKMNEVESRLNGLGYDVKGKLLKSKKVSEVKIARDFVSELSDGVDAYYTREETAIKERYLRLDITKQQMDRRLEENEREHNLAMVELYKALLNEENGFDVERFGMKKELQDKLDKFSTNDEVKQADYLQKLEQAQAAERDVRIRHREAIESIMDQSDDARKRSEKLQETLEGYGLFYRKSEILDNKARAERLTAFKDYAKLSQNMEASDLENKLRNNALFSQYTKDMKKEEYEALLQLLEDYQDKEEQAEARAYKRKQRTIRTKYEKDGHKSEAESLINEKEGDLSLIQEMEGLGLATPGMVEDAELSLLKEKLKTTREYYEYSRQAGLEDLEVKQEISDIASELDKKQIESQARKLKELKKYADALIDFSEQMGEAAFGEVKDRQEAAKQLLRTVGKLTKDLIMQWVTQKLAKAAIHKAMEAEEAASTATTTGIQAQGAIDDITIQGAKTGTDISLGVASGAAKTISKLGWWGIPLIAVIGAALSALLGAAMGGLSKTKSTIQSVGSGASTKTSMSKGQIIGYAKGNLDRFPVLADDGNTYNAKPTTIRTGRYDSPHLAVFGEKGPEMVISAPTTAKLQLYYPGIMKAIQDIDAGIPVKRYAEGNLSKFASDGSGGGSAVDMNVVSALVADAVSKQLSPVMIQLNETNSRLTDCLSKPLPVMINMYGQGGLADGVKKGLDFKASRTPKNK